MDRSDSISTALLRAVARQGAIGMLILDSDLRVRHSDIVADRFRGLAVPLGSRFEDLLPPEEACSTAERLLRVLETGEPLVAQPQRLRIRFAGDSGLVLALFALRLESDQGSPTGLVVTFTDITEQQRARHRLDLLLEISATAATSLDIDTTARRLAEVLVPTLGDMVSVNLATEVFLGEEPPQRSGGGHMGLRRAAIAPADQALWGPGYLMPGQDLPAVPDTSAVQAFQRGDPLILMADPAAIAAALGNDPALLRAATAAKGYSLVSASLLARGLILGDVEVWRTNLSPPFHSDELRLIQEIASQIALSIDNARRYTRERNASLALQKSMLPRDYTETTAAETVGVYLPSSRGSGVGGDWFDVVPLSSLRIALVVGDVAGHGLRATASMSRLRAAVLTLADLDLNPDELLARLDDLVSRLVADSYQGHENALGSTCLYMVYDPITCRCAVASAGHPPPVVVRPDRTAEFIDLDPGPPLGVGGLPFEVTEVTVAPGSLVALYSDGLVEHTADITDGMDALRARLADVHGAERHLEATAQGVLSELAPSNPRDDVTLLLAYLRNVPATCVASWEIPAAVAAVSEARELTSRQLASWGLEELAFTTELVVSELVTNAIRYAGGPITLRLIRDRVLVCEVSDSSNTQPRLRRAQTTDEGGRGLFLVAQLTSRWGSRYGRTGKTIWAEQIISGA
jgi:serine phosphatase RsbU (regulator of sigma subunit)/anti-sigma regulatory factor (Ser/Thr protein kinase)